MHHYTLFISRGLPAIQIWALFLPELLLLLEWLWGRAGLDVGAAKALDSMGPSCRG